ncbi:ammonia monooxygenase [Rhizobium sp. Root274]|uniref:AbrB family transcriptional regulator n=2 Tax=unclassified Rhizobium TaxID=2613769 RepID=UPI0007155D08|nr:AbrB family transcriptional regulator [Rhizobium sp. Root1240]KQW31057.1 ammonia monooxygenase [Rhizobium sp. Root1240]KRD32605.1 ammonia monooxygenase [Rhizobium sp. Root274]
MLTPLPVPARWAILLAVSLTLSTILFATHIPGALLLGPMAAAILVATNGARLSVHRYPYIFAHSLLGCIIARSLDLETLKAVALDWPIFLAIVVAVISASSLLGYLIAKADILPGTTAVWGTSAGAASAMVLMAEAHGADARLVAFMQYLRVVFVATGASVMAAFVFRISGGAAPQVVWFPQTDWLDLGVTLAAALAAASVGARLKIPAGTMLLPLAVTTILHVAGVISLHLPQWLLALAYGVIGWRIGLTFTRRILRHAASALPQVVGSILVLMAFCGGLAFLLWRFMGIDPLTAYLATSPGGLDSIAIIAASTPVDMSFVMALQTMRLILIIIAGPKIAGFVARRIKPAGTKG